MLIVAGLSLKNLQPRVWDAQSPYYLPKLRAVMVSYGDVHRMPAKRRQASNGGLHAALGVPSEVAVYLDNGAFSFLRDGGEVPREAYADFVAAAQPDWYAIPQDYIPTPRMSDEEQANCLQRTMQVNQAYSHDGYVPVIHVSRCLDDYLCQLQADQRLRTKRVIGLGAMVPNLLRGSKAMAYDDLLLKLRRVRLELADRRLHVFGIGGTATLHVAALLGVDSVDSSGWRNRAARGIVQLPGRGDRVVAAMGSWRGRKSSAADDALLLACPCPACQQFGLEGLRASGLAGFCNRATHNLWVLLEEEQAIELHLAEHSYMGWYEGHLDNTAYLPLIRQILLLDPPHVAPEGPPVAL